MKLNTPIDLFSHSCSCALALTHCNTCSFYQTPTKWGITPSCYGLPLTLWNRASELIKSVSFVSAFLSWFGSARHWHSKNENVGPVAVCPRGPIWPPLERKTSDRDVQRERVQVWFLLWFWWLNQMKLTFAELGQVLNTSGYSGWPTGCRPRQCAVLEVRSLCHAIKRWLVRILRLLEWFHLWALELNPNYYRDWLMRLFNCTSLG